MSQSGHLRVALLGATGTAGRATAQALLARGHSVTAFGRTDPRIAGLKARACDLTQPGALEAAMAGHPGFEAMISCLASRSGAPTEAWAIDHAAHVTALEAAQSHGIGHFVMLSALCVQKPRLAFQHAKLAFEERLIASGLRYSIVRPTAFFKSLSGQIARVKEGRPFLVFGDGRGTACKPISDRDLGAFIADCLDTQAHWNAVLPIGGPGPAITPMDQAEMLALLLGRPVRLRRVPHGVMDAIIAGLSVAGRISAKAATKAELARIGRYYAREAMLVWDAEAGRYDAEATPETGKDLLIEHYEKVLRGEVEVDLGAHALF
ncbi:MAG: NAD(P)H-binding protein [Pseudomonadota bacterium]